MPKSKLRVMISGHGTITFTDWYDFADWVKLRNLEGMPVTIISWEYVPPVVHHIIIAH